MPAAAKKKKATTSKASYKNEILAKVASLGKPSEAKSTGAKAKHTIEGFEASVEECVQRHKQIESLQAEQDVALDMLREAALAEMLELEEGGQFFKSCLMQGVGQNMRVTRSDSWSKLDVSHRDTLVDLIGSLFDVLFAEGADLKLRVPITQFAEEMDKVGLDVDKYFTRARFIKPVKGFLEKRAALRLTLEKGANEALDAICDAIRYRPSVGFKA